ncbi:MAG TPA: oligoendopeptidase F [candidate division Zixibacteria bacterium]|nr:oligoendopeptidase F [candidate division Zixibacteria bacterium]
MKQRLIFGTGLCAVAAAIILALFNVPAYAAADRIPQRSDIADKYKWKLEDMYPTPEAWEADFTTLKTNLPRFEQYKGHLGDSPSTLLACLRLSDSLNQIGDNLYVYAYLKLDEDNRSSSSQELTGRISGLGAEVAQATSFMQPELVSIGKDKIMSMLKKSPELAVYEHYFDDLFRTQQHILSEKEENILALAGPVTSSPSKIFSMVNDADINYGNIIDENGDTMALTKERYYKILESKDRRMRHDANVAYNSAYLKYINTLAATLDASVKKDYFYMKARGYNSCLEMSLDNGNIPTSVFHNLVDAVDSNLAPLHKWTALRKRILGYDTLYTYDLSVPLTFGDQKEYPYEEAKKIVLEGLKPMGKEYLANFEKGLDSRWIDVYETQGKGSGAYQWGTYTSHPYLLLNYSKTLESVFTLAHEMGHAMHSYYTNRNEPYIYGNHSLFVAEVASTCNEAVLMKYMLRNAKTKAEKMELLNYYIEQIIGTFYTQVMFSEFELAIHDRIQNGGALSADFFRKTYRDIYQKYWGPDLVIDSINDMGCMRISHFYREYYVYQYATCYAAAQTLSQKILDKDKGALDLYKQFLSTGSSKYPVDILKDAGVDMTTPDPVNRTIKLFAQLVDQMEQLLNEKG